MTSSSFAPVAGSSETSDESVAAGAQSVALPSTHLSPVSSSPRPPGRLAAANTDPPAAAEIGRELGGRTILVAEDNAIIAMDIQMALEDRGATVMGPYGTVAEVLRALEAEAIDCAVMDLDLGGELATPAIQAVMERSVPVVLTTGHDVAKRLPEPFRSLPVVSKPFVELAMIASLVAVLQGRE